MQLAIMLIMVYAHIHLYTYFFVKYKKFVLTEFYILFVCCIYLLVYFRYLH